MRTHLDCIPCFFKQALSAAKVAGADEKKQKKILDELSKLISDFPLETSPPEMAISVYKIVGNVTGNIDPYKEIKKESNLFALSLYPKLKETIQKADDRLLTAIKVAITGNIIDYGVPMTFDIEKEIEQFLQRDLTISDYQFFKNELNKANKILYIADNAGEVGFDKILIEELDKNVFYAVRDKPIINDATIEDAIFCGIDKIATVISNGSDAPGTVLKLCSQEFLKIYNDADLIISKGQGNFESLTEESKKIFFLFKVKCDIVAKDIGCEIGSSILKYNSNSNNKS